MAEIEVRAAAGAGGWTVDVTVREGGTETAHRVTLSREDYRRLAGEAVPPEELVRASFHFLLEREPKESILRRFDLPVIGRYFPEYEAEIRRRLGG